MHNLNNLIEIFFKFCSEKLDEIIQFMHILFVFLVLLTIIILVLSISPY